LSSFSFTENIPGMTVRRIGNRELWSWPFRWNAGIVIGFGTLARILAIEIGRLAVLCETQAPRLGESKSRLARWGLECELFIHPRTYIKAFRCRFLAGGFRR